MNRGGYVEWISANVLQTARVYWRVPVLLYRWLTINLCWLVLGGQTLTCVWSWALSKSTQVHASCCNLMQVQASKWPKFNVHCVSWKLALTCKSVWPGFFFTVSLSVQSHFLTNQFNCFHFEQNRFQGPHQAHMGNWYPLTTMVCMLVSPLSYLHICFM